jgi:(4S)-4-hydroxy-5-phosphonooxypentane-2,3-dione isomerase
MVILHVTVQVKPEHAAEFLEVVRYDAEHSEQDEPGCLRFDVIQDREDSNRFYFYEVYRDEAALEAHRKMPHYAVWQAAADSLDGPIEATRCQPVFPAPPAYWAKRHP